MSASPPPLAPRPDPPAEPTVDLAEEACVADSGVVSRQTEVNQQQRPAGRMVEDLGSRVADFLARALGSAGTSAGHSAAAGTEEGQDSEDEEGLKDQEATAGLCEVPAPHALPPDQCSGPTTSAQRLVGLSPGPAQEDTVQGLLVRILGDQAYTLLHKLLGDAGLSVLVHGSQPASAPHEVATPHPLPCARSHPPAVPSLSPPTRSRWIRPPPCGRPRRRRRPRCSAWGCSRHLMPS